MSATRSSRLKYTRIFSDDPPRLLVGPERAPFDLERLAPKSRSGHLTALAFRALQRPALKVLQSLFPVARFGRFVIVTRAADVNAILDDPEGFPSPFGPEMEAFARGATFLLGLDGAAHERQHAWLRKLIRSDDIERIRLWSRENTIALLDAAKGRIDVQHEVMIRSGAELCCRYFGFSPNDIYAFADWTIAGSNYLFADPFGDSTAEDLAIAASRNLCALADQALDDARSDEDTLAARLLRMAQRPDGPTRAECRAILVGLAIGFVPTNSLAGGKILQCLARRPDALRLASQAAREGDEGLMRRIVLEAGRLDPALAPGQWRWCPQDREIGSTGRVVPGGSVILVSTMAALRDPERYPAPDMFDPGRPGEPDLLFGQPPHECLGRELALAQIVPAVMILLKVRGMRESLPGMKMRFVGPYPRSAHVRYEHASASPGGGKSVQGGALFTVPVTTGLSAAAVNALITDTMRQFRWRAALDRTGIVHFLSLTAINVDADDSDVRLVVEVNCDGSSESGAQVAIEALRVPIQSILHAISDRDRDAEPWPVIRAGTVRVRGEPWGATGLQFFGIPDLTVRDSTRQRALARLVDRAVERYHQLNLGADHRASGVVATVRDLIRRPERYANRPEWADLAQSARRHSSFLLKPRTRRLAIAEWTPAQAEGAVEKVLRSRLVRRGFIVFLALAVLVFTGLSVVLDLAHASPQRLLVSFPWLVAQSITFSALIVGGTAALFLRTLRRREKSDAVDTDRPTLEHLRALATGENLPGHVKSHITVVTPLKRGLFRRLTLALGLWGIGQLVTHFYRAGFVFNMGTIQFARWVRLPGTDTMIFQSNFDGTWESYLEDFITRAHVGQTMAWSNCEGFPRSRYMLYDGARNGDAFKHYVRRKQVPTAFWYSRFPDIGADGLRRNALIHEGLCRATSESEARSWLNFFGSGSAVAGKIRDEEVQSIAFTGYSALPHAEFLVLRLSDDEARNSAFLRAVSGLKVDRVLFDRAKSKGLVSPLSPDGNLHHQLRPTFGEHDPSGAAVTIGISGAGLARLLGSDHPIHATLPAALRMGMGARASSIGDTGEEDPARWRWDDTDGDLFFGIYSADEAQHRWRLAMFDMLLHKAGIAVVDRQRVDLGNGEGSDRSVDAVGEPVDHFGFRDGIVQPIIEGTRKAKRHEGSPDLIAAGEMIIGYPNMQGFVPPPIAVPSEYDPLSILPDVEVPDGSFPAFGRNLDGQRDFGRNGVLMAVRVLEQHPDDFRQACEDAAARIRSGYANIEPTLRETVTGEWVAAKFVGRWASGASLIGNASDPGAVTATDYRLDFGRDDPQGLACPLSSHVRRANPRDSLLPGDPLETGIVNRHRILRRGRSYSRPQSGERGVYFLGLCENLERQFEFVQRTWLKAGNFHGLDRECDPLVGGGGSSRFSIPVQGGAIKVRVDFRFSTLRAGGYFLLPSRSALAYLANCHSS